MYFKFSVTFKNKHGIAYIQKNIVIIKIVTLESSTPNPRMLPLSKKLWDSTFETPLKSYHNLYKMVKSDKFSFIKYNLNFGIFLVIKR